MPENETRRSTPAYACTVFGDPVRIQAMVDACEGVPTEKLQEMAAPGKNVATLLDAVGSLTCAYCGFKVTGTDEAASALISAHITTCDKHPVAMMYGRLMLNGAAYKIVRERTSTLLPLPNGVTWEMLDRVGLMQRIERDDTSIGPLVTAAMAFQQDLAAEAEAEADESEAGHA